MRVSATGMGKKTRDLSAPTATAVHVDRVRGHEGARVRAHEQHQLGDFLRLSEPLHRHVIEKTLHQFRRRLRRALERRAHRRGGPGSSVHYAAAKGAVVSMTLGVAREFAQAGIRCLSISPGPVRTPFQSAAQTSPELMQRFLDDVPMKRFGEPEEIAELVLFICSDACAFMTADTVYVNGGGGWR